MVKFIKNSIENKLIFINNNFNKRGEKGYIRVKRDAGT
jgi:hypothetical protein